MEVTLTPFLAPAALMLNHYGIEGYYTMTPGLAHELNKRTKGHADQHFAAQDKTPHLYWYQLEPSPPLNPDDHVD